MKSKAILVEEGTTLRPRYSVVMACDPGKSGGLCWNDRYGNLHAAPMPETLPMLDGLIERAKPDFFLLERVRSSPQMGVTSAFTFGRGFGAIEGILTARKIFWKDVTPQTWIKHTDLGKVKDHESSRAWKKHLVRRARKIAPRLFLNLNVGGSLKIADAVLLWKFATVLHAEYHL